MVLLKSSDLVLDSPAPNFSLLSVDNKEYSLDNFADAKALLVAFICNHCPYVKAIEDRLIQLAQQFSPRGVQFIAICSNDSAQYPEDSRDSLFKRWQEKKYGFPYLLDTQQIIARAYGAVCTPDFFVYDGKRLLVYHGQLDDNWKEPNKVFRQDLREALEAVLAGRRPQLPQFPSLGCSIKWRNS